VDELYVIARRVPLDALEALGPHRDATILVGAQAIYLHTGDADLAVAEYTTDADLALDPDLLSIISCCSAWSDVTSTSSQERPFAFSRDFALAQ